VTVSRDKEPKGARAKPHMEELTHRIAGERATDTRTFGEWLRDVPSLYAALTAAVVAVMGLLSPNRFFPAPIADFNFIPSLVVVMAIIQAWVWRVELQRNIKWVVTLTFVFGLLLFGLNVGYVRAVDYYEYPPETISYLTGGAVTNPAACGADYNVVITQCGGDWAALSKAWGSRFYVVTAAYVLTYVFFVVGLILSISSSGIVGRERSTSAAK
jgi:hypothetical protein